VGLIYGVITSGLLKFCEQTNPHFSRGFARKGNRENLLRMIDPGEKREDSLGQEFGLARPGRRCHAETFTRVESLDTSLGIARHDADSSST
jgi:hypothetical protein